MQSKCAVCTFCDCKHTTVQLPEYQAYNYTAKKHFDAHVLWMWVKRSITEALAGGFYEAVAPVWGTYVGPD